MLHLNDRCFYSCFLDDTLPAMPKTRRQSQPEDSLSRLYILSNLLRNKRPWFVICYWWISIPFVCFYVSRFVACFLKSTVSFTLVLSFFFNFFTLKRGKFRFQRWNCSYRASISRGNTDTEGWKRTGSFPLTFTYADKRSGCHSNGLIDVAEKFEHAQYELSRMSTEVPSSSWLIEEDRRRLCSQGTPTHSNLSKTNLNRMQRPGETQEEHFELINVDGVHVNAGSEGSASENPKPVLMRTTTGKNDNENASKERPVRDVGGAVHSEVTANSNSFIIQGAEQASWRPEGSDAVLDSLNVITQTMQQQMNFKFRRMMYLMTLLLVIILLTAAVSVGFIVKTSKPERCPSQPSLSPGQ